MDDSKLDTSKSFTGDIYLEEDGIRRSVRINDNGWLQITDQAVLPTTLWFGCYREDDGDFYIIKEYTKGGSKKGSVLSLNNDGYLGFYSDSQRPWRLCKSDGEELVPRTTPEAHIAISTKGGRKWTVNGRDCIAQKGEGSNFLVHIHRVGIYHF